MDTNVSETNTTHETIDTSKVYHVGVESHMRSAGHKPSETWSLTKPAVPKESLCGTPWRHKAGFETSYKIGVRHSAIRSGNYITSGKREVLVYRFDQTEGFLWNCKDVKILSKQFTFHIKFEERITSWNRSYFGNGLSGYFNTRTYEILVQHTTASIRRPTDERSLGQ
jgi:hypothetical protein